MQKKDKLTRFVKTFKRNSQNNKIVRYHPLLHSTRRKYHKVKTTKNSMCFVVFVILLANSYVNIIVVSYHFHIGTSQGIAF